MAAAPAVDGHATRRVAWPNDTTFKFEYLHIDLGDQNIRPIPVAPALGGFARASSSNTFEIVRAAINVRF